MFFSYHKTVQVFVICLFALAGLNSCRGTDGDFVVAENGKARAVVITADDPTPVALLAAEELTMHVKKSAGVKLRVIAESETPASGLLNRIYIGASEAVKRGGVNTDTLPPDAFVLRRRGNDLFIAGKENGDNYDSNGLNGTLFGVYEFLHRYVGVRWLWPGELGTYVPQASRIAITDEPDVLEKVAFSFRRFRTGSLSARFMNALDEGAIPDENAGYIKAKKALQELVDFRKSHEQMYFSDLEDAAWREAGIEGLQELLGELE
jgi:hypothetical protein